MPRKIPQSTQCSHENMKKIKFRITSLCLFKSQTAKHPINSPMDKGIIGFSGFGVSFSFSTISLITFLVFLEIFEAGTFHDVLFSGLPPFNNPSPVCLVTTDPDAFLSSPLVGIITRKILYHKLHLSQKLYIFKLL